MIDWEVILNDPIMKRALVILYLTGAQIEYYEEGDLETFNEIAPVQQWLFDLFAERYGLDRFYSALERVRKITTGSHPKSSASGSVRVH